MNKFLLFLSCIIAVIADMGFVWWAKNPTHPIWFLVGAIILNIIGLAIWAYTMRNGIESAMAITAYSLMTVAGCSFLGVVIFKEALSTVNAIGMILAMIALVLISL
jgi:multidrug transporter EmrE-like cation transporter